MKRIIALGLGFTICGAASAQTKLLEIRGGQLEGIGDSIAANDLNGDGVVDLIVGMNSSPGFGAFVRAYSGATSLQMWQTALPCGNRIAEGGDIDGDGHPDLLVGDSGHNRVLVLSGLDGHAIWTIAGSVQQSYGISVCNMGDITGDGRPDFAFGAGATAQAGGFFVQIRNGATNAVIRTIHSPFAQQFANSIASIEDLNADGIRELLLGDHNFQPPGSPFSTGRILAISPVDGSTVQSFVPPPGSPAFLVGLTMANAGDVDADGVDDVIAGCNWGLVGQADYNHVFVFSGASAAVLFDLSPGVTYSAFGSSVAGPGDVDGDGSCDILIGEKLANQNANSAGRALLYSGATGALLLALEGSAPGMQYGAAVAAAHDVDGDGRAELAVSAHQDYPGGVALIVKLADAAGPTSYCSAKLNSLGCLPAIGSAGRASFATLSSFLVRATNVINNKPGLFIYSHATGSTPFQGGTLCISGAVRRTPSSLTGGSATGTDCSGVLAIDFNDRIQSGVDPSLTAGAFVAIQAWYRDPLAAFGSGLSNALSFTIAP